MKTIRITANGEAYEVDENLSLPDFLEQRGLKPSQVVTERNGEPLTQSEARDTLLQDGDRLEVVRIVSGG